MRPLVGAALFRTVLGVLVDSQRFQDCLSTADPMPAETAGLAKSFMRSRVRKLQSVLAATDDGHMMDGVLWLGPELHFYAAVAERHPDEIADLPARLREMLARNRGPGTELTAVTAGDGPWWVSSLIASMNRDIGAVDKTGAISSAGRTQADECLRTVRRAQSILAAAWPGAAVEVDLLVRSIVPVVSHAYNSGCMFDYFGAVLVSTRTLKSDEAAVEFLLHETGHTVHHLMSAFTKYVENGDELVVHPLRPDPRPVSGTLHAAFSLYRMSEGLSRLADHGFGSSEQEERFVMHRDNLRHTLDVLGESAQWTPAGEKLFSNLSARAYA
jgi:HEXXH motif-containing protein